MHRLFFKSWFFSASLASSVVRVVLGFRIPHEPKNRNSATEITENTERIKQLCQRRPLTKWLSMKNKLHI
jgi:hypothetical protein